MAKVADIKLSWKKSVSADVAKVKVVVTLDGQTTEAEHGPEVEEIVVTLAAGKSGSFHVVTIDSEGFQSMSLTHEWTLGDLEAPQPATALGHEVVAVRDV